MNDEPKPRWPEGRRVVIDGNNIQPLGLAFSQGRETVIYNAPDDVARKLGP